jgi:hypothetical protein
VTLAGVIVDYDVTMAGMILRCAFAEGNAIVL